MAEQTQKTVLRKLCPVGEIPIELANLEIIADDPLPGKGTYNQGSIWDHLILRLESKFTASSEAGPSCILPEINGMCLTSRARFLGYVVATRVVSGTRKKDPSGNEIKKTGKLKIWLKGLPGQKGETPKEVIINNG